MKKRVCVVNCCDFDSCIDILKSSLDDFDLFFMKSNSTINYRKEMNGKTKYIQKIVEMSTYTLADVFYVGKFNLFGEIYLSVLIARNGEIVEIVDINSLFIDGIVLLDDLKISQDKDYIFLSEPQIKSVDIDFNSLTNNAILIIYSHKKLTNSKIKKISKMGTKYNFDIIGLYNNDNAYFSNDIGTTVVLNNQINIFTL